MKSANLFFLRAILFFALLGSLSSKANAQVVIEDSFPWSVDRPIQLAITFCDNACRILVNGRQEWANGGAALPMYETFRLDPHLEVGKATTIQFIGVNSPKTAPNPNPWRFNVLLQDVVGAGWSVRKDYSRATDGDQPEGTSYILTLKITGR